MSTLIEYDKALFLFLNGLGSEPWDGFWMFMTDKLHSIPLYLILVLVSIKKFGLKATLITLFMLIILITITDQLSNAFKYGFARLRPCYDESIMEKMRLVRPTCGGRFSFFSGHAVNASALATFFSLIFFPYYKWLGLFLGVWAFLVAYSRIYIGVHYPLDILTGISIGMFSGWVFYKFRNKVGELL